MSQADYYRRQAAAALQQASEATLPSVRERCQRSAAAWEAMAEQMDSLAAHKARNLANKAVSA